MVTNPKGGWDEGVVCLGHADPQRASLAIRFRDEHAPHRLGAVRPRFQVGRQFVQPPVQPVRLDVLERLAVDPRRAVVGTTADVGPLQHVLRYTLSYSA